MDVGTSSPAEAAEPARRLRVVFFGFCLAGLSTNGGSLCSRTNLLRLSQDPGIDLTAVLASPTEHQAGNAAFLGQLGIRHHLLAADNVTPRAARPLDALRSRWPMTFEYVARTNSHIDRELRALCDGVQPDYVVVEYVPSMQLVPSLLADRRVPVAVATANREGEMLGDMARRGGKVDGGGPATRLGAWRCGRFERWVHRRVDLTVSIGRHDLPSDARARRKSIWIAPMMDAPSHGWSGCDSPTLFFIGNIWHYPNRDAIEWLAGRLAPALASRSPAARIANIGAERTPSLRSCVIRPSTTWGRRPRRRKPGCFAAARCSWRRSRTYGAKFKVAEAIAYGMPVLGTDGAMSGVPFLDDIPRIDLSSPDQAAAVIQQHLDDRDLLADISRRIVSRHTANRCHAAPPRRRAVPASASHPPSRAWPAHPPMPAGKRTLPAPV
jgi:hypothetical protein